MSFFAKKNKQKKKNSVLPTEMQKKVGLYWVGEKSLKSLLASAEVRKHRGVIEKKKYIYREILRYISLFRENISLFREKYLVISRNISCYFTKNILFRETYLVISRKYPILHEYFFPLAACRGGGGISRMRKIFQPLAACHVSPLQF